MKLAIIGSSPLSLEAALRFHSHGASITWFKGNEASEKALLNLQPSNMVSELGLEYIKNLGIKTKIENWFEEYEKPLTNILKAHQRIKTHQVVAITKRYLAPEEVIPDHSRFHDLYRIIYQVNPEEFIQEQKENNPETYQRLTEEFINSLQSNLEMYEDFDLILNFSQNQYIGSINVNGRALGEFKVGPEAVSYGLKALEYVRNNEVKDKYELALIGSTPLAAVILLNLFDWLKDSRRRLFIVSTEADPFAEVMQKALPELKEKLMDVFNFFEKQHQTELDKFHLELRQWQSLDEFIQAKKPKPTEPIPRLVFFSGHNATAIDQMIDKRKIFLTLEKPDFRQGIKHPENNHLDLKTIGVDKVLCANTGKAPSMTVGLSFQEVGYFERTPNCLLFHDSWMNDLKIIEGIEDEVFKLFSPFDSH